MSIKIFLSTVSDEFREYRDRLRHDLTRHNVEVKVQEDFVDLGGDTLDKLDVYIAHCDAVVHLIGDMTGSTPGGREQRALLAKRPDLARDLPPLAEALRDGAAISYTQWEAWLALYHGRLLLTAKAEPQAERGPRFAATEASRGAQTAHLARLEAVRRYPGCAFADAADLARHIAYTAILDLLVQDYAQEAARARYVAEGFIREMAARVAKDRRLDLDGMKEAVRNAIGLYEREIAGGATQTNFDAIVDAALVKARAQFDAGKTGLANATLLRAAEQMRRDEAERRERYAEGVTLLYNRARDFALAAYDADAAAAAIIALAETLNEVDAAVLTFLAREADALHAFGRDRGSNVHLASEVVLRRKLLNGTKTADERGGALIDLGSALWVIGGLEAGTARLEEAVKAFRASLNERSRERVPLDWATTQNKLGNALWTLGERESGAARLEEAVDAYRTALEERTRERVPLQWAMTQNNLGNVLNSLGRREPGTARLEEAVEAFRAALEEYSRERAPLDWAMTQNNLGNALALLGERESDVALLEQAIVAYRAALEEWTRERVPLDWATTQNNLGNALRALGDCKGDVGQFDESVEAFRSALQERSRERVPLQWAITKNNLGSVLMFLGERENGMLQLEEAVEAFRDALEECTRERVPFNWAMTQSNLGTALLSLVGHTGDRALLDQALEAVDGALEVYRDGTADFYIAEAEDLRVAILAAREESVPQ